MRISSHFDGGRIEAVKTDDFSDIQVKIKNDSHSEFRQWFYFRLQGVKNQDCVVKFLNAADTSYVEGWQDYDVCASTDRQEWFRIPTEFDGKQLTVEFNTDTDDIYLAYFAPYPFDRHLNLLAFAQQSALSTLVNLGETLDGRDFDMLVIEDEEVDLTEKLNVWMIARQHPGETMAEWFVEGFLESLLDQDNPTSRQLLQQCRFHVVPNMNPDGSYRGNLRTNASGANLNREWMEPTMTASPEVYLVREQMHARGVDLFLDIHGDEAIPYNFVAGCEGNPNYNERLKHLEDTFKAAWAAASPDFQDVYKYDDDEPGKADLRIATNYVGQTFNCLSYTVEQPFKDNHDLPDEQYGWSPERCKKFGEDVLIAINNTVPAIKSSQ
ncbi:M14 family metallopeptidase [Marinicella meishanensis]|uniref:M14 family metallopeptidase n=1 Tax=Marinicella meishanensis TaxID=2873263 RepID=UPI001CBDC01E|nr:M14-type cytosolic carboxypeptidase [Marinicella sp. NBU2979]